MKTVGIISEYNPFHNGHKYHIEETKNKVNASGIISIMSGSFVQRGEFAMADKYSRAAACVSQNVDICFELPTLYALGSAREFARGAVAMLAALNVDYISFGAETDDISLFNYVADIIFDEPTEFKDKLKEFIKSGCSYPKARALALSSIFPSIPADFLSSPNNILGIEYLAAIRYFKADLKPIIIKRLGAGYNDTRLEQNSHMSSATGIRKGLSMGDDISTELPPSSYSQLEEYIKHPLVNIDGISDILAYRILSLKKELSEKGSISSPILDLDTELLNKLLGISLKKKLSFSETVSYLLSKNYTETRIKRTLFHLLLDINEELLMKARKEGYAYYANLLAVSKEKTKLLKALSQSAAIPVITKKADFKPCGIANDLWNLDIYATDFYSLIAHKISGLEVKPELSSTPVIIL